MKGKCKGTYARTLRLTDRYFFCENCRECPLSEQLPDWDENAEWEEIVEKINGLYPYKVMVWIGNESIRPTIKQYPTIDKMIEDVNNISYIAGQAQEQICMIEFFE